MAQPQPQPWLVTLRDDYRDRCMIVPSVQAGTHGYIFYCGDKELCNHAYITNANYNTKKDNGQRQLLEDHFSAPPHNVPHAPPPPPKQPPPSGGGGGGGYGYGGYGYGGYGYGGYGCYGYGGYGYGGYGYGGYGYGGYGYGGYGYGYGGYWYGGYGYGDHGYGRGATLAKEIAHRMLEAWQHNNETDASLQLSYPVDVLRMSTVSELNKIWKTLGRGNAGLALQSEEQEKLEQGFQEALAIAGTRNTFHVLVEKIMNDEIPTEKAVQAMKSLTDVPAPSDKQAKKIESLCKNDVSRSSDPLKQSCWLAYGTLVAELCREKPVQAKSPEEEFGMEKLCPRETKEHFKKTLVVQYNSAESAYEKVLALKALGNAGLDVALRKIEEIIMNIRKEPIVRIQAIHSLRCLRHQMPHKIHRMLMPVFENDREQPEVRMAAFAMIEMSRATVRFNGQEAFVSVSPIYKNGLCGLCGHYDGERDDELRMQNNELTSDLKEVHRSYVHPSEDECTNEEFESFYAKEKFQPIRRLEWESQEDDSDEFYAESGRPRRQHQKWRKQNEDDSQEKPEPIEKTEVMEYHNKICFSMKPVKTCPKGTDVKETTEETVPFKFLRRSDIQAQCMLKQASSGGVLDLADEEQSLSHSVNMARSCVLAF